MTSIKKTLAAGALAATMALGGATAASAQHSGNDAAGIGAFLGGSAAAVALLNGSKYVASRSAILGSHTLANVGAVAGSAAVGAAVFWALYKLGHALPGGDG